jgi:drug/metabolite transporter (DMT)-like permease
MALTAEPTAARLVPGTKSPKRTTGITLAIVSSACFGTSGTFGDALLRAGWSPAGLVTARITLAAIFLTIPAFLQLRKSGISTRILLTRPALAAVVSYGLFAVAGCQVCYFNAVARMPVGIALLLEYLGIVLVVGWLWVRHGQRPRRLTVGGGVTALAGLALMLNLTSAHGISMTGVFWGLGAAVGLCIFFVLSSAAESPLPPVVLAWGGMCTGAIALGVLAAVHAVPFTTSTKLVDLAGSRVPWLVPVLGISLIAGAVAYAASITACRRLGARLASFIALAEVLFATLFAWIFLSQLPTALQFGGGALILAGVTLVRLDER